MKRFYKHVSVGAAENAFTVLLDGKAVRTPGRNMLVLPTKRLAEAIVKEWQAQGEKIIAATMPLLRLANTAVDGVAANRDGVIGAILRFGENDLLCYRAHQPPELAARQREAWDPLLDWVARAHGANLRVVQGLTHIDQPAEALAALHRALERSDAFSLVALHVIASITGSAVLALAVADGLVSAENAFGLSRIDETYQAEKWGEDAQASRRARNLTQELDKAVELMAATR
ncbi:MAG TPA: ATP12 family protein [Rhizomicrobium sp.]|nr:ATP12 family protein [Rhizomicrobium sp.]